jgi:hypothetical protein
MARGVYGRFLEASAFDPLRGLNADADAIRDRIRQGGRSRLSSGAGNAEAKTVNPSAKVDGSAGKTLAEYSGPNGNRTQTSGARRNREKR